LPSVEELINKKVTVKIIIVEAKKVFTIKDMTLVYDSVKKPKHRLEAFDKKGNAIFIMLE